MVASLHPSRDKQRAPKLRAIKDRERRRRSRGGGGEEEGSTVFLTRESKRRSVTDNLLDIDPGKELLIQLEATDSLPSQVPVSFRGFFTEISFGSGFC
ncbi:hypothetical protein QQP08_002591 [Theobroma cacao]|nr:hypothetical protein QQP08_002591 [Theobroma cacao]